MLTMLKVDEKSNEITAIPELLKVLCLENCVVTIFLKVFDLIMNLYRKLNINYGLWLQDFYAEIT